MQSIKLFKAETDIELCGKIRFRKGKLYVGKNIDVFYIRIYDDKDQGWDFGLTFRELPPRFYRDVLYDNRTMYRYPEKFTLLSKNILMPNRKEFCSFRRMLRRENNDGTKGL